MGMHLVCMFFGMAGNLTVEVVRILRDADRGRYHRRYSDRRFWMARGLMILQAGILSLACSMTGMQLPIVAFHVGVAATLVVNRMQKRVPALPRAHQ